MKKLIFLHLCFLLSINVLAQKSKIDRLIKEYIKKENLSSSSIGIMATTLKGKTLANFQGDKKLIPASNMKLITTALALKVLGDEHRFYTRLAYSGSIQDSVLYGNIYVIGGGDPSLFSQDSIAQSDSSICHMFLDALKANGIGKIKGLIVGDARYFSQAKEHPSWSYQDIGSYYGSGSSGLNFYRNSIDIQVVRESNDKLKSSMQYPNCPWLKMEDLSTVESLNSGDELYLYANDFSYNIQLRGSLGREYKEKSIGVSNKFPALTTAYYLASFLDKKGISAEAVCQIDGYNRVSDLFRLQDSTKIQTLALKSSGWRTEDIIVSKERLQSLCTLSSPPLKDLCKVTNHLSDNVFAECIFRELSKYLAGESSYTKAGKILVKEIERLGISTKNQVEIVDGSGLSRKNRLSPKFMCKFLSYMAQSSIYPSYLSSMEIAGKGNYKKRLAYAKQGFKNRIHMKSGSMNGVRCYSGYIEATNRKKDKLIIFSIMINNSDLPSYKQHSFIDRIIYTLAKEN